MSKINLLKICSRKLDKVRVRPFTFYEIDYEKIIDNFQKKREYNEQVSKTPGLEYYGESLKDES